MMSLRRFAVIAPLTFKLNKHNTSDIANATTPSMATQTPEQSAKETTATTNIDIKQTQAAAAAGTATATNSHKIINDDDAYIDESNYNSILDSNETHTNLIDTNTAGKGLQTIRASFGLSGLIGHNPGGISSGGNHQTYPHTINGNANLLLCGAMLSVVTTILCVVCYCCHRNIKKRTEAAYRQQHQWLESDPNMEIYSVEQSYETSGPFLGESSDGFSTLATLHHEPPPSYDAVVAMQEQQLLQQQLYQQQCQLLQQQQQHQQQQQTHVQHNSPPPGYRSTLAVNEMATPTLSASAAASNLAIDTLNNDSNGNLRGSCNNSIGGNSCSNFFACGKPNVASSRYSSSGNNNSNNAAFLNMKKALNAQSCCSLQRAEVENMWNAAAAAVAVRASHATSSPCGAASLTGGHAASSSSSGEGGSHSSNRCYISPMLLARKSLPLTLPAKFTAKTGGKRYLPHHSTYYRRGCPLCGKFRYDADEALTLSVESGLDVAAASASAPRQAISTQAAVDEERHCAESSLVDSCQQLTAMDDVEQRETHEVSQDSPRIQAMAAVVGSNVDTLDEDELQKCACAVNILEPLTTAIIDSDSNGNNNLVAAKTNFANVAAASKESMIDQNANGPPATEEVAKEAINTAGDFVDATSPRRRLSSTERVVPASQAADAATPIQAEDTTLDAINANSGIIRVDMSQIIDQTGLPTYEAAAKLESSGYV